MSFAAIMKALPLKQKTGVDIFGQIWEKFGAALILTFGHTVWGSSLSQMNVFLRLFKVDNGNQETFL